MSDLGLVLEGTPCPLSAPVAEQVTHQLHQLELRTTALRRAGILSQQTLIH